MEGPMALPARRGECCNPACVPVLNARIPGLRHYSKVELRLRPGHWAMLVGTLLVEIVAIGFSWGREPAWDTLLYAVYALANVIAGVLILARRPGHRIGWLLIATGLVNAIVSDFAQGWALVGTGRGWPGAVAADLVFNMSWPIGGVLMAATFVLFPDGSFPQQGRVWPWVLPLGCLGAVVAMAGWATGDEVTAGMVSGRNPLLSESVPSGLLFWSGLTALAASMILGALAMVLRMRQAHGVERQQLKWMVAAVSVVVFTLPFGAPFYSSFVAVRIWNAVVLTAVPLAALAAIWRYRLYDIELIISRTVLYACVTAVLGDPSRHWWSGSGSSSDEARPLRRHSPPWWSRWPSGRC